MLKVGNGSLVLFLSLVSRCTNFTRLVSRRNCLVNNSILFLSLALVVTRTSANLENFDKNLFYSTYKTIIRNTILACVLVVPLSALFGRNSIYVFIFSSNKFQRFLCRALVTYVNLLKSIRYIIIFPVK